MKITIDTDNGTVTSGNDTHTLASAEGFALASKAWVRAGWDAKHVYSFTWMGRPIIQLPEDVLRLQELIWTVKPDVVIETGVAHGGSLVLWASILAARGRGRVVGIDIEIRPHNRAAIEAHEMASRICLVEGSSIDPGLVERVAAQIRPEEKVLVILDSNHTKDHVLAELKAYAPLVSVGSYLVAMDGIMGEVAGAPRTNPEWAHDNPTTAVAEWLRGRDDFALSSLPMAFNEGAVKAPITYGPGGVVRRVK